MNSPPVDFARLLNLLEDYYEGGYRSQNRIRAAERDSQSGKQPGTQPQPQSGKLSGAQPQPGGQPHPVEPSVDGAPPPSQQARDSLDLISNEVSVCRRCGLCRKRIKPVPGEGAERPTLMLIGEGPGAEEDRSGRPFVGAAGRYLDKWLKAIDLDRAGDCFIGNIVKCRPPGNRDPLPEESTACLPYLERQIACLKPQALLTLGRIASQILIGSTTGIGALRGKWYRYRDIPLLPTYHPSAVLRNSELRVAVWADLKMLRTHLDDA